ncbi:MAG: hypothetical protein NC898_04075, partial [Candidatus Omnitrophica bacterium]|nr:hypothetical protein [Candidatus Omnitrophota bacterium]
EIERLSKELEGLNDLFQKKEVEYRALISRIEILEEMKKRYEGYSPGVRSLMLAQEKGELSEAEIIGVLAEMMEVERGFEKSVESALGNYAQAILVKDYKSFSICLDYIRKNKLGELYFLILEDWDKEKIPGKNFGNEFKYLFDFVHLPPHYEFILHHLFAQIILVNNLEEGLEIKKGRKDLSIKWVSYQGEMGEENFVKTAPVSTDEDTAIIGRDRRIKDLKTESLKIEEEKKLISTQREAVLLSLEKNKQDLLQIQEEKHALEIEVSNLGQEVERLRKDLKRIAEELSVVNLEREETTQEIKSREEEIEKAGNRLQELELREERLRGSLEETNRNLEEKNALREKTSLEITEIELGLKSHTERLLFLKDRISALEISLAETEKMILARGEEITANLERAANLQEEIASLEKENLLLGKGSEEARQKLNNLNIKKMELKGEIEKEEKSLEALQQNLESIKNKLHELQIKMQEIDFNKRDIRQRMESAYKVSLDTIEIESPLSEFDLTGWEGEINSLRERLSSLGPVNLIAIEEFGQLQERYNFLLNQQADLFKAKESLHEAINRIKRTAQELFIETFQKIEVNFKEIFRLLFGGGNTQMVLLEPDDVLESGIEIIAQPPGKKLQNISLLSGGERALTAVALLFAIFKVKPSPFCILDEVDAPLDEANIDRFRMLMKEFSKTSQFIVITHNKKTIAVADVMYGVTMEESGVSKLVSVKFSDAADKVKVETEKT